MYLWVRQTEITHMRVKYSTKAMPVHTDWPKLCRRVYSCVLEPKSHQWLHHMWQHSLIVFVCKQQQRHVWFDKEKCLKRFVPFVRHNLLFRLLFLFFSTNCMILYSLFWRIGPRCYKNSAELYNLWIEKKKQSAVTYRGIEGDAALDLVVLIM